jgi:hypothetical protein
VRQLVNQLRINSREFDTKLVSSITVDGSADFAQLTAAHLVARGAEGLSVHMTTNAKQLFFSTRRST